MSTEFLNESKLSRTKSSLKTQMFSEHSLQTLANLEETKSHLRESSRMFNDLTQEVIDSSCDESLQMLENQVHIQRTKDSEGACLLRNELDQFIGLLQKVKQSDPQIEPMLKTNLSVIISTDESLASKQSPIQDYYSFTNQNSRVPSGNQSQKDLTELEDTSGQFQKLVGQKSEVIQEGFKRCLQSLTNILKQQNLYQAIAWVDKLAAIQTIQVQQQKKLEQQIQQQVPKNPQLKALRDCINQQEKEIEQLQKQNLSKCKYQSNLECEIRNILAEQSKDRQVLLEYQQKNMQLKNLILVANKRYEELLARLSETERRLQDQEKSSLEIINQLQHSNKVLRSIIATTGDPRADQLVEMIQSMIQNKSRSNSYTKSESVGRKENNQQRAQRKVEVQKSPVPSVRGKLSEFHSGQKKQSRLVR